MAFNWTVRKKMCSLTSGLTGSWKGALRMLLKIKRVSRSHFCRVEQTWKEHPMNKNAGKREYIHLKC